jgi:hypothetical protein
MFTELHAYVNDLEKMVADGKVVGEENVKEVVGVVAGMRGMLVLGESVVLKIEKDKVS